MDKELKEKYIQHTFMQWVQAMRNIDARYKLIFPVFSNAQGNSSLMGLMKLLGVTKGVHDVIGLVPNKNYHGFTIEFKSRLGKPTPEQIEFAQALKQQGFAPFLIRTAERAQAVVKNYMTTAKEVVNGREKVFS